MRRAAVIAVAVLAVAVLAVATGGSKAAGRLLLGITGNVDHFKDLTGQVSDVHQAFLGWGQGETYGAPFKDLLPMFGPIPMLHLGTAAKPPSKNEAITPAGIAAGQGDSYLIALNTAIGDWHKLVYVRPMALGLRPVGRDLDLPVNPYPGVLRVIWNPVAGTEKGAEPAARYYPGDECLDMIGNDMYSSSVGGGSFEENQALYNAHPTKPYSLPEWGLENVDDPGFVQKICDFAKSRPRTQMLAYYNS
jgi:hypothetical protein